MTTTPRTGKTKRGAASQPFPNTQSFPTKTQQNSKKNDPVFKAPKSEDGSDIDLLRGRQEIMKVISALGGPVTS